MSRMHVTQKADVISNNRLPTDLISMNAVYLKIAARTHGEQGHLPVFIRDRRLAYC